MLATEFHKRLKTIGVDYSRKAILKWAHKGFITPPQGRTKSALWTDEAVGEAAAVYVLRKRGVSFHTIEQVIELIRIFPNNPSLLSGLESDSTDFLENNNLTHSVFKHVKHATVAYWKALEGIPLITPTTVHYTWAEKEQSPTEMEFPPSSAKQWIFQGVEVDHGKDICEDSVLPSYTHAQPTQKQWPVMWHIKNESREYLLDKMIWLERRGVECELIGQVLTVRLHNAEELAVFVEKLQHELKSDGYTQKRNQSV